MFVRADIFCAYSKSLDDKLSVPELHTIELNFVLPSVLNLVKLAT